MIKTNFDLNKGPHDIKFSGNGGDILKELIKINNFILTDMTIRADGSYKDYEESFQSFIELLEAAKINEKEYNLLKFLLDSQNKLKKVFEGKEEQEEEDEEEEEGKENETYPS